MDEELKQRLLRYLDSMEEGIEKSAEFVADQAPDVVQQWLAWEFWSSVFFATCCIVTAVASAYYFRRLWIWADKHLTKDAKESEAGPVILGLAVLAGMCIGTLTGAIMNAYSATKVSVAPKVVIVEKMTELAKSIK